MIIEKQDHMRRRKSRSRPAKKYSEGQINHLTAAASSYGGLGSFDVMLEELDIEPNINCSDCRVISVPLWD